MKKILLSISALVFAGMMSLAAPVERIYLSTDRSVYLAGDAVWCSLTCLDENGRFSNASAVSYVELVSTEGTACTAKIGLLEGRGAGSFRIPVTTPTGTYRRQCCRGGPALAGRFAAADGVQQHVRRARARRRGNRPS